MKRNRLIAAMLLLAFTSLQVPISGNATNSQYEYNIENDLDADGNWKYRELVPDTGCESAENFYAHGSITAGSTVQDALIVQSGNAHSGNFCIKRTMRQNPTIAFKIAPSFIQPYSEQEPNEYIISSWMRADCPDATSVRVLPACNYMPKGSTARSDQGLVQDTGLSTAVDNTWKYVSKKIRFLDANTDNSSNTYTAVSYRYNDLSKDSGKTIDTSVTPNVNIQTLYIDDWSMRLAPQDDFMRARMISSEYDKDSKKIICIFNLDIDPRTVSANNIEVNGASAEGYISSCELETTDETTREQVLTLNMENLTDASVFAVSLAGLRDAWGRTVDNNEPVIIGNFSDGQYTVFDDYDDSGKWKYRELMNDIACETSDELWTGTTTPTAGNQTDINLSSDAYRGEYSICRKMSGYSRMGKKADNLDVYTDNNPAEYIMSMYAKADMADGLSSVNIVPCYRVNGSYEKSYVYPGQDVTIPINSEWNYYKKTLRIQGVEIDKSQDIYTYFYANAKDTAGNALLNTIYLDEWSLRRSLPEDFFATQITDCYYNDSTAVFEFNLDIDPRTVRAQDIKINGVEQKDKIKAIDIKTDKFTRLTTLTIELCNLKPEMDYNVGISKVADAWGREIEGTKEVSFTTPPAIDYSVNFECDGKKIDKMTDGNMKIDFSAKSNYGEKQIVVVAAVYKNKRFVNVVQQTALINDAEKTFTLNVDAGQGNDGVRLFIWNKGTDNIGSPITAYSQLTKNGYHCIAY